MKCVGILGGMGPEATVELMARVIRATPASDDADHVPLLVDQNPQVPSRIARLIEGRGEDPLPVLIRMAQRLQAAGAEALAMPCNTAHHYAAGVAAAVDIPFLNMLEAAEARLAPGAVGLLASPAVRLAGVFDAVLAGREVWHPPEDQALGLIRQIKSDGATDAARETFAEMIALAPVPQVLVACTEFSLVAPQGRDTVVDALDALVDQIVRFAQSG